MAQLAAQPSATAVKTYQVGNFTFYEPSTVLPPIPALRCCNGIHKGVDCNGEVVATYNRMFLSNSQSTNQSSLSTASTSISTPFQSAQQPTPSTVNSTNSFTNASLPQNVLKSRSTLDEDDQPSAKRPRNAESTANTMRSSWGSTSNWMPNQVSTSNSFQSGDQIVKDSTSYIYKTPIGKAFDSSEASALDKYNTSSSSFNLSTSYDSNAFSSNSGQVTSKNPNTADIICLSSAFTKPRPVMQPTTSKQHPPGTKENIPPKPSTSAVNNYNGSYGQAKLAPQFEPVTSQRDIKRQQNTLKRQVESIPSTSSSDLVPLSTSSVINLDMHGKFKAFLQDSTAKYDDVFLLDRNLYERMERILHDTFGFKSFRHCQRSVVIAALLGRSCCVLMPTGAGKSLCYQLTAVLCEGLTVVVSPLLSLMSDQLMKLKSLKIPAQSMRGDSTKAERDSIFQDLNADVRIKLLYVAPEMLSKSTALIGTLQRVYNKGKLSRIIIDEAHCISSWGHDFRPDYGQLTKHFADFKNVPIMALTATATPQAVVDIRQSLQIENSELFISSFVRDNLQYDIMPKSAANFKKLIDVLKQNFRNSSGIIYCLSRQDCEDVAKQLNNAGLSAVHYHAKLSNKTRESAQMRWMRNEVKIICATIAFGMGIDKPDVRYVIHHSMSSSIESYYQETGRAGRDGLPSKCILMYAFSDHVRYLKLFQFESGNTTLYARHRIQSLLQMLAYCENVGVCYRKILVEHFGEFYDAEACRLGRTPCNNCETIKIQGVSPYKAYDFTAEAIEVLKSVKQMTNTTLNNVADLYRGVTKKTKNAKKAGEESKLPFFGRGEGCSEEDIQRFVRKLLVEGYLEERLEFNRYANVDICYVGVADKGHRLIEKKEPKVYSYLTVARRKSHTSRLYQMPVVSESTILKEKYKLKHISVFRQAKQAIYNLIMEISLEENVPNPYNIISPAGVEELAAVLPRTESEMLKIDSITPDKMQIYGARIKSVLQVFWNRIDELEHNQIRSVEKKFHRERCHNSFSVSLLLPGAFTVFLTKFFANIPLDSQIKIFSSRHGKPRSDLRY